MLYTIPPPNIARLEGVGGRGGGGLYSTSGLKPQSIEVLLAGRWPPPPHTSLYSGTLASFINTKSNLFLILKF